MHVQTNDATICSWALEELLIKSWLLIGPGKPQWGMFRVRLPPWAAIQGFLRIILCLMFWWLIYRVIIGWFPCFSTSELLLSNFGVKSFEIGFAFTLYIILVFINVLFKFAPGFLMFPTLYHLPPDRGYKKQYWYFMNLTFQTNNGFSELKFLWFFTSDHNNMTILLKLTRSIFCIIIILENYVAVSLNYSNIFNKYIPVFASCLDYIL